MGFGSEQKGKVRVDFPLYRWHNIKNISGKNSLPEYKSLSHILMQDLCLHYSVISHIISL